MKKHIVILLLGLLLFITGKTTKADSLPPVKTDTLSFVFEGKKLTGLLDLPVRQKPLGLVLLIPGSGPTNMVEGNGYYRRLRYFFAGQGFACYVWDKPGCGKSEGDFKGDLTIKESASEAITAIETLQRLNIPGSDKIGLWGLSRGGWVCPQIITDHPSIKFWISVSGPDGEENFAYLLEKNWLIEGRSKKETKALVKSWHSNLDIARHGGTWEENKKATALYRNDPFYTFITKGSPEPTEEGYLRWQKSLQTPGANMPVNEKTGLQVYFPGFDTVLRRVDCPVLAVFGEKDSQVDWQKTIKLYKKTMGKNAKARLTIKTFRDGNHNLFKCKTGGFREKLEEYTFCEGYLEAMSAWLKQNKFE